MEEAVLPDIHHVDRATQDQGKPVSPGFCGTLQSDAVSAKEEQPLGTISHDHLEPLAGLGETIGQAEAACQTEPEPLGNLVILLSTTDGSEASTQVSHIVQCDKGTQEAESGCSTSQDAKPSSSHVVTLYTSRRKRNRYKRSLDPNLRHEPWRAVEDIMLLIAVRLHGDTDWTEVASMVPGHGEEQCRDRYREFFDPLFALGPYTAEEDYTLLLLIEKHGLGQWVKLAQEMPWRSINSVKGRYRLLCETLGIARPTPVDLERYLSGPVGPVTNVEQRTRRMRREKRLEVYRTLLYLHLLRTKTMKRTAAMLLKGQGERADLTMCMRLYRKVWRLDQEKRPPRRPKLVRKALNKAIAQYAQTACRVRVSPPSLCVYEHQEWHAVANVLHDLHGLPMPPPNSEVEEVGTVPMFEEFFSKEVLSVPGGFQPNDGSLVLPLLPPNETTVPAFGRLLDRFTNGNLAESLPRLLDGHMFSELCLALDADCIEDIRCTECASGSLLELSPITAKALQKPCFRCSELQTMRKNYEVLQARFISYFFWPAVLDTMDVAETVQVPSQKCKQSKRRYKLAKNRKPWVRRKWEERRQTKAAQVAAAAASAAAQGVDAPEEDGNSESPGTSATLA
ncbi:uncharacterized protein LOC119180354 isoform X1 [Rhipicephalus microplus]